MKSGDKLQLSASWWKKNKAITASNGGLEKTLKTYETENKLYQEHPSVDGYAKTLAALKKVEEVAKAVAADRKSIANKTTREALEKTDAIATARKDLQTKQADYEKRLKPFVEGGENLAKKIDGLADRIKDIAAEMKQLAPKAIDTNIEGPVDDLQHAADEIYGELEELLKELQQVAKLGANGLHPLDAGAAATQINNALKTGAKAVLDAKKLLVDLPKLLPENRRVAKFQLTARWWRDNRGTAPDEGLEEALTEYEVWTKKVKSEATTQTYPQLLHAIDEVSDAVKQVVAKLNPGTEKELAVILRGAASVIKSERDPIDKAHRAYVEKVAVYMKKQADYLKLMQMLERKTQAFSGKLTDAEKKTVGKKLPVVEKILAPLVRELKQLDGLRREGEHSVEDSDDGIHRTDTTVGMQTYRQASGINNSVQKTLRDALQSLEKDFTYASGAPEVARGNKSTGEKPMNTGKKEQPPLEVRATPAKLNLTPGKVAVLKFELTRRDDFKAPVNVRLDNSLPKGVTLVGDLPSNLGPNITNLELKLNVGPELTDGMKNLVFSFRAADGSFQTQRLVPASKQK